MRIETIKTIAIYLEVNPKTVVNWYRKREENGFPCNKELDERNREVMYGDDAELTQWLVDRRKEQAEQGIIHG